MRLPAAVFALSLVLTGCARSDRAATERTDADTAAYKMGKAAHTAADKTKAVTQKAGEKIKEAAKSAEQGWKDSKPK